MIHYSRAVDFIVWEHASSDQNPANYDSYAEQTSINNLVAPGVAVVVATRNYNQDSITVAEFGGAVGKNPWDRTPCSS